MCKLEGGWIWLGETTMEEGIAAVLAMGAEPLVLKYSDGDMTFDKILSYPIPLVAEQLEYLEDRFGKTPSSKGEARILFQPGGVAIVDGDIRTNQFYGRWNTAQYAFCEKDQTDSQKAELRTLPDKIRTAFAERTEGLEVTVTA